MTRTLTQARPTGNPGATDTAGITGTTPATPRVPAPRTAAPRIAAGRIAVTPAAGIPPASPLSALLRRQQGVLSAAQAAAHGLPHETLRQRVLRGIWQRLLPGVYALQCGPPTWRQWLIAALVYAGDGSMLTGSAALLEHAIPAPVTSAGPQPPRATTVTHTIPELPQSIATTPGSATSTPPPPLPTRIDVLVPHRTRRQSVPGAPGVPGVRVIRATRLPTPTESGPIRLAPPARAIIDACFAAAACGDTRAVEATADQVLRSGQASLADLEAELARAPRRHSSHLRNHLARLREQARTAAAKRLAAAADSLGARQGPDHGNPLRDVVLYSDRLPVARAAALWPTRAVAAAVDAPPHELESLKRLGFAVIQVSPHSVDGDLPGVLRRIGGVLKERPEAVLPAGVSMVVDVSSHRRPGLSVS